MQNYFLETNRLRIRRLQESDLVALSSLFTNPTVMQFSIKGRPLTPAEITEQLKQYFAQYQRFGFSNWAVELKENSTFIGIAGIHHMLVDNIDEIEIGYRLLPAYWGHGYATEAVMAIRDYAFNTLGMRRLIAIIEPKNERSIRVAEKLNMAYEKDTICFGKFVRVYALHKYK